MTSSVTSKTTQTSPDIPTRNFRINEKWEVTAEYADAKGNTCVRSFNLGHHVGCNSEGILRNIHTEPNIKEPWDPSWPAPTITPEGALIWNGPKLTSTGELRPPTHAKISEYITNVIGLPKLRSEPTAETTTIIPVKEETSLFSQLKEVLKENGATLEYTAHPIQEGVTVFHAKAAVGTGEPGHWFKAFNAEARASVFEFARKTQANVTPVEFSVLAAKAGVQFKSYVGADLSVGLVVAKVSAFDAKLGIGISTGVGVRDEALEVRAAGCGFTVGKRIGISILDNSLEINFGRLF